MKRIALSPARIAYRHRPRVMLVFAAAMAALLGGSLFVDGVPVAARMVVGLFVVIGLVVGLSRTDLVIGLTSRMLVFEERFAGIVTRRIRSPFDHVESILVHDMSVRRPEPGVTEIRPAWGVELKHTMPPRTAMQVGVFDSREAAHSEARLLSGRMKRPIVEMGPRP